MRAEAEATTPPRICVIYNPHAGRRRAERRLARFRSRWEAWASFWPTSHAGQARELAHRAVHEGYAVIAAAGGDGTVHEVANGLLQASAARPIPTLSVIPVGSANDYAYSVTREFGVADLSDEGGALVDIGVVETSCGHQSYFVESIGLGLSARVTERSREPTRRQGLWLYGAAALKAVLHDMEPVDLQLQWDRDPPVHQMTTLISLMLGAREGGFQMAPDARLSDGLFDAVHAGPLSRWGAIHLLPKLAFRGPPLHHPDITIRRCRELAIVSDQALTIHTDGELFARRSADIRDVKIRLLPSWLRVRVCRLD